MKSFLYTIRELFEIVLIALVVVIGVKYFLVQPYLVSGSSMEPTFENGNYILVNQFSYYFREPQRGESIVFKYPGDEKTYFIKRIIGLPGERIVVENGKVSVIENPGQSNQKKIILNEKYLPDSLKTTGDVSLLLKSDEYFVMGDNRSASFDSRVWGAVKRNEIIGTVWVRLWPLNEISTFEKPSYGF